MKKKVFLTLIIISIFSIFCGNRIFAQNFDNYEELVSHGYLPLDYIINSIEKFELDKSTISETEKRQSRKQKEQFYLESNFSISDLVKSGNIIFNDTISNYLLSIYNNIKNSNPVLQDKDIRFYTCKSTIINAFATHAGIIFINIGLVAKIETEDELAYIMCHEISHFLKNHNIMQYTFNDEVNSDKGQYKEVSWEKKMFSKANYSQKHELEADSLGLILYMNTDYCIDAPMKALNNLKTYNLPFSTQFAFNPKKFEVNLFNYDTLHIADKENINVKEYKEDSLYCTHPQIDSRVARLVSIISSINQPNDSAKVILRPNKTQQIAQFELPHIFLETGMPYHALYCSLALLSVYENNNYLESEVSKSLYAISQNRTYISKIRIDEAEFKNSWKQYCSDLDYESKEIQQVYMFMDKLSISQMTDLAINNLFSYCQKNPTEEMMFNRLQDLIISNLIYFNDGTEIDTLIKTNSGFAEIYNNVKNNSTDKIKTRRQLSKGEKPDEEEEEEVENENLNIEKLIFINPESRIFDLRKKQTYRFKASEQTMIKYIESIKMTSAILNIDNVILSSLTMKKIDVELLNDLSKINTFIAEDNANSPWTLSSTKDGMKEIINKYGTDKLALVGTYSFQMERKIGSKIASLTFSIIFFPILPLGVLNAVSPQFETVTYVLVYDLSNEQIVHYDITPIRMAGNNGVINSTLYNSLYKLKNK